MATVAQVHAHHGVSDIKKGKVYCQISLSTAVRLHVGVLGAEKSACPVDCNLLYLIHIGAAAVIALAGETLCVFIGEHAAHGGHDCGGNEVLAGDELDVLALPCQFAVHGGGDVRVLKSYCTDGV